MIKEDKSNCSARNKTDKDKNIQTLLWNSMHFCVAVCIINLLDKHLLNTYHIMLKPSYMTVFIKFLYYSVIKHMMNVYDLLCGNKHYNKNQSSKGGIETMRRGRRWESFSYGIIRKSIGWHARIDGWNERSHRSLGKEPLRPKGSEYNGPRNRSLLSAFGKWCLGCCSPD